MIFALCPDDYTDPATGRADASSPRWADLLRRAGHEVKWVDVCRADILDQVRGCDGFMWRWGHTPEMRQIARRLLPVIERERHLAIYPDQRTCWHYDDKVAQAHLLSATGIPTPRTWVWHDAALAKDWARSATYPLVAKLSTGAGSTNVRLVESCEEATRWIDGLFGRGFYSLNDVSPEPLKGVIQRFRSAAKLLLTGIGPKSRPWPTNAWELHRNYALFQEFLPANPFDTRVTVVGNRAFAFRRFNREGDFRASGSGRIDHNPGKILPDGVNLAFRVAGALGTQSCAMDILRRGTEPVVCEISYTYASWAVHECPGHWALVGGEARWRDGQMWPEEAQVEDFLTRIEARRREGG